MEAQKRLENHPRLPPTSDPREGGKRQGVFKPEATAMVRDVLTNELSDAKTAARLGKGLPHSPTGACVWKEGSHTGY